MAIGKCTENNLKILERNSGIYTNNFKDIIDYCYLYDACIQHSIGLALWEPPLVYDIDIPQKYFCNKFKHLKYLSINCLEIYKLIENDSKTIPWTHFLCDKTILVINPFIDSFQKQINNNFKLFNKSDKYIFHPNQKFIFYKCFNCLAYNKPHNSWKETYEIMCNDISKFNFDIALLGCGGYGLPLCYFIKTRLNKSAIYIGGFLQILFGVTGKRWENEEWLKRIKEENIKFIKPNENESIPNSNLIEDGCYW